jgi:glycosyltransferase involved in cell wall biosynthesis
MKPLVSVIIPVFNKQNYVSEAIESVFAQTYAPIEIIAVNDGSTDNSLEVISRYLNDGIQVIDQKNSGVERARNLGFSKSVGSFIVFLDADDLMKSNRITKQIDLFISDPNLVLVGTWANVIDRSGNMVGSICPNTSNAAIQLGNLFRNQFVSSSVMVRRSAIADGLVFNESRGTRFAEDFDLWNRVSKKGLVANIPEKLTSYRRLEVSRSHSSAESLLESARDISAEWLYHNTNCFESVGSARSFVMSINGLDDLSPNSGRDMKNTLKTYDLVLSELRIGKFGEDSDEYKKVRKRHKVHILTWSLLGCLPLPIQRKIFSFLSFLKSWPLSGRLINKFAKSLSK